MKSLRIRVPIRKEGRILYLYSENYYRLSDFFLDAEKDKLENFELFTGRSDKHGVDVYEGDYIQDVELRSQPDVYKPILVEYSSGSFFAGDEHLIDLDWSLYEIVEDK